MVMKINFSGTTPFLLKLLVLDEPPYDKILPKVLRFLNHLKINQIDRPNIARYIVNSSVIAIYRLFLSRC